MKNLLFVILAFAAIALSGCSSEPDIIGCTDAKAINYNPNANVDVGNCIYKEGCTDASSLSYDASAIVDNGTCKYGADLSVWWNQTTAKELRDLNITELKVYMNEKYIGKVKTTMYWTSKSKCSAAEYIDGLVGFFELNDGQVKTVNFVAKDQNDNVVYSDSINITKGCNTVEFT